MAGGVTLRGSLSDMTRRRGLLAVVGAASLIYLAALAYYAMVRSIDTDEGYYVSAARLVWEGKVPYRDFFFPQAPMLAYLYGWIWGVPPGSLVSMRLLSAGLTAATALLWGVCLVFSERLSVDSLLLGRIHELLQTGPFFPLGVVGPDDE